MIHFATKDELERWLRQRDIDLSRWGQGAAKSVSNLWAEIQKGESVLSDDPPLRTLEAVRIIVRRGDAILIEAYQGFVSGRRRARGWPPSEKLHPGEHYADAALRCLREELGVEDGGARVKPETYRQKVLEEVALSYPGLRTRYTFHIVDAVVPQLPSHAFKTREKATGPGEPISVHFWEWRKA